jgi:UDPglucose 6-dehydrogenase
MTITFVGHGYVGLVTACVFADFGNQVYVIGHTQKKIDRLKKGDPIIYEPGLKELLQKNLVAGRLHISSDYSQAVRQSDIVFITVGTPPKENGEADLSAVYDVAKKIAKNLKDGLTVISCKSTVPVGTNKKVEEIISKAKSKKAKIAVASCPEFLREGTAIADTLKPDRVVIGTDSPEAREKLLELHKTINGKRVLTDLASAELIKYASNSMLATKISFANLISFYCERTGADVEAVLDAVGLDRRIGRIFLYPGIGYGGSCLPKDVSALIKTGELLEIDRDLLTAVDEINRAARNMFLNKILKNTRPSKIAVWGVSFKPDTDDIRYAPSINIISGLIDKGYKVRIYDPQAANNIKDIFKDKITYADSPVAAVTDASALCILTEWNEFKQFDLKKVKKLMEKPVIFDGRNIYDPAIMKRLGFKYFSIGRPAV